MLENLVELGVGARIAWIAAVAIAAHLLVSGIRWIGRHMMSGRVSAARGKVLTVTGLVVSVTVFAIYFVALGFILKEFGISLAAYFASASIIGLAVGFGSQGLVQDVVTGLTLIFADLIDVGEMVEISGQTGIVHQIGIRFTVLMNFNGAEVFIPNRTIGNVVNYPRGYVRALLDVRLPEDPALADSMESQVTRAVQDFCKRLPGIFITPPTVAGRHSHDGGPTYLRIKLRFWPGQQGPLEALLRPEVISLCKALQPSFQDWMAALTYETEEKQIQVPVIRFKRVRPRHPGAG